MKLMLLNVLKIVLLFGVVQNSCLANGLNNNLNKNEILISQDIKSDATLAVLKNIQEAKKNGGNTIIAFEKAVYHFYPEYAFEKYQFFSNHGDYLTRFGFFLENMDNLTIDGNGSKFIFHGIMAPFLAENCNNLNIRNLEIDFDESFYSEGTVIACDTVANTIDLRISEEYPYEIRNNQLIFLKSYYEHPIGQSYSYDSETRYIAFNSPHIPYMTPKGREFNSSFNVDNFKYKNTVDPFDNYIRNRGVRELNYAEQIAPGLVRIHSEKSFKLDVGWVIVMKGHQGFNRLFPGFKFENCIDLNLENITLYHAAGMGYLFENCENTDMYKCSAVSSNNRYVSVTADATHYSGCRGALAMRDCIFESELDDGTNIHGAYQMVEKIINENTIGVRAIHHQQLGFVLGRVGDTIGVVDPDKEYLSHAQLTLESIERLNGRFMLIKFKETLPEDIKKGYLLENLTAYPEVLIENSSFSKNRARALLISTPKKTIIRNNFFSTEMAGIILGGVGFDSYWGECGYASNVLIEGNTFRNCGTGYKQTASLVMNSTDKYKGYHIKNIVVKENKFEQSENWILDVGHVDGVIFKDNVISNSGTHPQRFKDKAAITIKESRNISFISNEYNGKAKNIVEYLDDSTIKVKFN